jgi:hypothetical protein
MPPVFRNNCIHRVVSFAGHSVHVAPRPPPQPQCPERARGRVQFRSPTCLQRRRHTEAIAMLYRGIEYSVVQRIERHHWKWAASVSGTKISGYGSTRDEAIGNAKKAIERYPEATLQAGFRWRRSMTIGRSAAARGALACALISVGGAAVAQGAPRQRSQSKQRANVPDRPARTLRRSARSRNR